MESSTRVFPYRCLQEPLPPSTSRCRSQGHQKSRGSRSRTRARKRRQRPPQRARRRCSHPGSSRPSSNPSWFGRAARCTLQMTATQAARRPPPGNSTGTFPQQAAGLCPLRLWALPASGPRWMAAPVRSPLQAAALQASPSQQMATAQQPRRLRSRAANLWGSALPPRCPCRRAPSAPAAWSRRSKSLQRWQQRPLTPGWLALRQRQQRGLKGTPRRGARRARQSCCHPLLAMRSPAPVQLTFWTPESSRQARLAGASACDAGALPLGLAAQLPSSKHTWYPGHVAQGPHLILASSLPGGLCRKFHCG